MKKLKCVTEAGLIKMIEQAARSDSLSNWARANGVQPSAPSAFINRKQPAGKQIPAAFGLVPITVFVEKGNENYFEYPRRTPAARPRAATPTAKKAESKKLKKDLKKSVKIEKKGKKRAR